jgi:SagB-type dehydrogenase family enzyme
MSTIPLNLETDFVALPAPGAGPQATLRQALAGRHSTRHFLPDALPLETLSALLWSAFGVNRPAQGGRTAPSANNWQEIDVYAVLDQGSYRYDAVAHRLMLLKAEDLRALTGMQDFVAAAPLNLVYVADFARMKEAAGDDERAFLAGAAAGCIAQNVYLYAAAAGLGTVVRGLIDRRRLAEAMGLARTQRIALAQTVGVAGPAP